MNKEELTAMVAEILQGLGKEPAVKASDYRATAPEPEKKDEGYGDGDFVPDVTALNLRKLYLTENPADPEKFRRMKEKTPARLGCGKAGPRYKTLTMLRFRADHAAAQDAVFSEIDPEFAKENDLLPTKTRCDSKDEYLTRPDLGRRFDEANQRVIKEVCANQRVLLLIGDGLSSEAITANAAPCAEAIRRDLKNYGIELGRSLYIKYCRVGASDHIGDLTGCELVCLLVGERPGLVTNGSMSAYITYKPYRGIPESKRTVVSNIHSQGLPAPEAGMKIAALIDRMLKQKASGLDLSREALT